MNRALGTGNVPLGKFRALGLANGTIFPARSRPFDAGGTVKGIAMMTKERSKVLPNVPTGIEQGGGVRCS
jgi:tripartite-type tricarboxylate transporter receptor subunit TctC